MKHQKLYVNHSSFGKVEYFSEGLPPPLSSNYLECGKAYSRKQYPQVVCDLFPYDISKEAKDNFATIMTSCNIPVGWYVSATYGWHYHPNYAFDNNPDTCWLTGNDNGTVLEFFTGTDKYTLWNWSIISGTLFNITIDIWIESLGKYININSISNPINSIRYFSHIGIHEQLEGATRFRATLVRNNGTPVYSMQYYTVKTEDLINGLIHTFKVPEAPEKLGYKAYVNIDYRGIEPKHYL